MDLVKVGGLKRPHLPALLSLLPPWICPDQQHSVQGMPLPPHHSPVMFERFIPV